MLAAMAPPRILAATDTGVHILGGDAPIPIEGGVTALAAAPDGWLAGVSGNRLVIRSTDGRTWTTGPAIDGPQVRCVLPHGSEVLAGTAEAALYAARSSGAERVSSFDEVAGRDTWSTPWGGPPDTRSLAEDDGAIHANVHVGGIPRSRDGGATWEPTIEVDADVHQVVAGSGLVLAPCAFGLGVSTDGGDTWRVDDDGLHASYCRAAAISGDMALVSASTGPFTRQAALYRRSLGSDGAFDRCGGGLPEWFAENIDTHLLDARDGTAAVADADGRIWRSDDDGAGWDHAGTVPGAIRAVVVVP
jgi:hypothetical protein